MTDIDPKRPFQKHMRGPSRTQPQFADESNINTIMRQFEATGVFPDAGNARPQYGDFAGYTDYHDSMNKVLAAQDAFMAIPAEIRKRFDNDPGKFLQFAGDDDNFEEMVALGLLDAPDPEPPELADGSPLRQPWHWPQGTIIDPRSV